MQRVELSHVDPEMPETADWICSPLTRRSTSWRHEDPRAAELVKLRFFAGLTNEQAAEVARAYLHATADRRLGLRQVLAPR